MAIPTLLSLFPKREDLIVWSDELQLFHNPNARIPVPSEWLSGLTQHCFKDGKQYSVTPEGHVLASMTPVVDAAGG
jgi:hypothetical protein